LQACAGGVCAGADRAGALPDADRSAACDWTLCIIHHVHLTYMCCVPEHTRRQAMHVHRVRFSFLVLLCFAFGNGTAVMHLAV